MAEGCRRPQESDLWVNGGFKTELPASLGEAVAFGLTTVADITS